MNDTVAALKEIVLAYSQIEGIYVHPFPNSPSLQDKIVFDEIENEHFKNALSLREEKHVPFWDALMLSFFDKDQFSLRILGNVINSHASRKKICIKTNAEFDSNLQSYILSEGNYAINSEVKTSEPGRRHLLLLDFQIPESPKNNLVVEHILRVLEVGPGYLFRSGRSYHFMGSTLITIGKLTKYLGKCLLFSPIIDKSWIAHQLIDRSCSLRFTQKNGMFPELIKKIK
ncbi:MAG: hypothetical protein EOO15_05790 [Chitinophagaceae bacterium]|nr:MAG: hypothetical protein EOO15_05790 [Chitinophagaceae bacterium]